MNAFLKILSPKKKKVFGLPLDQAIKVSPSKDGLPLPVSRSIQRIESKSMEIEGIYRVTGIMNSVHDLIKLYDSGADPDLQQYDPFVVTSMFKKYFVQLPDPILTFKLHDSFLNAAKNNKQKNKKAKAVKAVLDQLPAENKFVLKAVVQHLIKLSTKEKVNKMSVHNLAIVFGPSLFRSKDENPILILQNSPLYLQCVICFLNHFDYMFNDIPDPSLDEDTEQIPSSLPSNSKTPVSMGDNVTAATEVNEQWEQMRRSRKSRRQSNRQSVRIVDVTALQNDINIEANAIENGEQISEKPRKEGDEVEKISEPLFDQDNTSVSGLANVLTKDIDNNRRTSHDFMGDILDPASQSTWKRLSHSSQSKNDTTDGKQKHKQHDDDDDDDILYGYNTNDDNNNKKNDNNTNAIGEEDGYDDIAEFSANQTSVTSKKQAEKQTNEEEFLKKLNDVTIDIKNPYDGIVMRINMIREREGRSGDLNEYSAEEMEAERKLLKKELRNFEKIFEKECGREPEKSEKESLREIFTRYKDIKQMLTGNNHRDAQQSSSLCVPTNENYISPTSPLYEIVNNPGLNSSEKNRLKKSIASAKKSLISNTSPNLQSTDLDINQFAGGDLHTSYSRKSVNISNKRNSIYSDNKSVVARLNEDGEFLKLRKEKKELLKLLHKFEDEFREQNGRKVSKQSDKEPMQKEYNRYKVIKNQIEEIVRKHEKEASS